ncbi:venom acid phosphatase Acph-1 isoform X2 [Bombus vancouverensis nearcticus]|uniref:acid phosphatase n=1 Tax=Bombus bifarius TaxID=103933 RepID=A0A6P8LT96_9HYME|nr:venom acid phosphatase Acph-1-like isoform X1 [Bombus vancouverensis nearcticus]XP_033301519.1 venom acid phosphatase Acph-1-like isoform X1 [Bombus bifarius]
MSRIKLVLTVIILLVGSFCQVTDGDFSLELVQVLFRHGDRTPREKEISPVDYHNISIYEPWGLAQLTNEGKMREYRIGTMLKERYGKFLGDIYHPSDVYAYSTDHDRTKMSLQLVLAGLYHPTPLQTWNQNLSWMPIPIYYMPEKIDNILKPDLSPLYMKTVDEVRNTEEILRRLLSYRDLFKLLSEKTGLNITTTYMAYELYNQLVAKQTMNHLLPEWYTEEVSKKLQDIVKIEYEIRSYTPLLKRLNGGVIIRRFIDNIRINEKRDRPRKIYLYSGHEVNVAAVVRALNLTEPEIPPYGSAIIFEKLKDLNNKVYIRMLFWNGVTDELKVYKISECDEICPIEKYLNIVNDLLPSDEEVNHKWDYLSKEELHKLYIETLNVN